MIVTSLIFFFKVQLLCSISYLCLTKPKNLCNLTLLKTYRFGLKRFEYQSLRCVKNWFYFNTS